MTVIKSFDDQQIDRDELLKVATNILSAEVTYFGLINDTWIGVAVDIAEKLIKEVDKRSYKENDNATKA